MLQFRSYNCSTCTDAATAYHVRGWHTHASHDNKCACLRACMLLNTAHNIRVSQGRTRHSPIPDFPSSTVSTAGFVVDSHLPTSALLAALRAEAFETGLAPKLRWPQESCMADLTETPVDVPIVATDVVLMQKVHQLLCPHVQIGSGSRVGYRPCILGLFVCCPADHRQCMTQA